MLNGQRKVLAFFMQTVKTLIRLGRWVQSPNRSFCHTVIHIFRNKHEATASELKLSLEQNTELKKEIGNREKDLKKLHKEAEVRLLWNSEKDH